MEYYKICVYRHFLEIGYHKQKNYLIIAGHSHPL